jgi:hypothetical protein
LEEEMTSVCEPTANVTLADVVPESLKKNLADAAHEEAHHILDPFYGFLALRGQEEEYRHGMVWFVCACLLVLRKGVISRNAGLEECCNEKYRLDALIMNSVLVSMKLTPDGRQKDPSLATCSTAGLLARAASSIRGYCEYILEEGGTRPPALDELILFTKWWGLAWRSGRVSPRVRGGHDVADKCDRSRGS